MRVTRTILFLAVAAAIAGCDQMPMSSENAIPVADKTATVTDTSPVIATVNGETVTRNLFDVYQRQRNQGRPGDPNGRDPATVLDEIINLELAAQDGVKQGVDKQPEVAAQIDQQRRAVIASATLQKQLADHPVTDEDLQKFYDEKTANLGSEYKARHILVADESKAKDLIVELDKGADFGELAKANSTDTSAQNGGELGWFSPQQMVEPFSEAVQKLEKGKYTAEPVQTQFGWHVIVLDDVRDITPPPLDQVRKQLEAILKNQRIQDYVQALRESAKIDIDQANMPAAAPEATAPMHGHPGAEPAMEDAHQAAEAEAPASEEAPAEAAPAEEAPATEAPAEEPAATP